MTDDDQLSLPTLLDKLRIILQKPIDFTRTDTQSTAAKVRILTATATYLNIIAVTDFGGRLGAVRAEGLVEQVIGAAFQTYEGNDPHPDAFDKAAMLLRGIVQGHPFHDGNKRTGFLIVTYYLERMGYPLPVPVSEHQVVELCIRVSAGAMREFDCGVMRRLLAPIFFVG